MINLDEISLADLVPGTKAVAMVAKALGTTDETLAIGLCRQLAHIGSAGQSLPVDRLNFTLSAVAGICPRDPTEALLASQMVAIHCALMEAVRRAGSAVVTDRLASELGLAMQLAKVSALQVETLKRYRSKGEQHIHVHRPQVTVNADKAVVGIGQGDGGERKIDNQPVAKLQNGRGTQRAPLLGQVPPDRQAMPSSSGEGMARLPDARGQRRRTVR